MKNNLIVLKIGGSVLTDKARPFSVNKKVINSIASQIEKLKNLKIIIVHGGGSFGHPLASKYDLVNGIKKDTDIIGISETHHAMLDLNRIIIEIFIKKGIPVITLCPIDLFLTSNGRIKNCNVNPIEKSLQVGNIPILFGDTVYDTDRGVCILSGDQIVTYLGIKLNAKKIILGTDIDGLYSEDPKNNSEAKLIKEIKPENFNQIKKFFDTSPKSNQIDVTGGMFGKIKELITAAKAGIEVFIINAKTDNNIEKILKGNKDIGTRFIGWS